MMQRIIKSLIAADLGSMTGKLCVCRRRGGVELARWWVGASSQEISWRSLTKKSSSSNKGTQTGFNKQPGSTWEAARKEQGSNQEISRKHSGSNQEQSGSSQEGARKQSGNNQETTRKQTGNNQKGARKHRESIYKATS